MYGKLDVNGYDINGMGHSFEERYAGTPLEDVAIRLDDIVEMYQNNDIDKDTAAELIQDIKNEEETEELSSTIQMRSDFIKAADFLMKVL